MSIALERRRYMGARDGLPYDAQVEYLQSSGTQYIDTGIVINSNHSLSIGVMHLENDTIPFGSAGMIYCFPAQFYSGGTLAAVPAIGYQYQLSGIPFSLYTYALIVIDSDGIKINGVSQILTVLASTVANDYTMLIFARRAATGEAQRYATCRIYSLTIYEGSTKVLDFIPVRVGEVGYMYDQVSGELFGNAGSGSFTLGPDV